MPRYALASSFFSGVLLALVSGAGMGCAQILGIEDLPALDPDARRPPDARRIDAAVIDASEPDARTDDARPPDAAVIPPDDVLVDRDLLTRYFIDEASSGSSVTTLQDSAADPLPLTIDHAGAGAFVEESGNLGLRWNALTDDGRASALLSSSNKIVQALDGSRQGTIEVVVDIDQFVAGSRISHLGEADDRGLFTLRLEDEPTPRVRFIMNNDDDDENVWDVNLPSRGRTVLHLVLDTTQGNDDDRVLLYVDGVEQQSAGDAPPARDEAIDILSPQPSHVLGNSTEGQRGILGTIFYAAMYSTALDPDEVAHNADILLVNDDAPGN